TSILHALARRLAPDRRVRRVSLEGDPVRTVDELAVRLELMPRGEADPGCALLQRLREEGDPVLLLDEVAYLHQAEAAVFAWLRLVGQEAASLVLAGSHWDRFRVVNRAAEVMPGSSFGNDVKAVDLSPS